MRKLVCGSCSFNVTEADSDWDKVITSGKCPKCSYSIQITKWEQATVLNNFSGKTDIEILGELARFFCVIGGIAAIAGGVRLATLNSVTENSLLASIANGIGWYCIGKGIFMIAIPFQASGALSKLLRR